MAGGAQTRFYLLESSEMKGHLVNQHLDTPLTLGAHVLVGPTEGLGDTAKICEDYGFDINLNRILYLVNELLRDRIT